jgi:hypothetical protein
MKRTQIPTRLQGAAIDRVIHVVDANAPNKLWEYKKHWRVWLHTNDHVYGTYLELHDDGSITRVTVRDGYDERVEVAPKDE